MDNSNYNFKEIEAKWQKEWVEKGLFSPDIDNAPNPYYNLMMFPYPSAEGLHVGNMYAFTGADVFARFNRMQGKDVLEPIGLDGFGIHSENYAMKAGRHPKEQAEISEKNYYRQLHSIGNSFDWKRTVETYDPDYYKWTQWLFTLMFKNNLAYRKTALVNWCPKDMTVLSDEQVIAGECERCGTKVERRDLEQWFFRITNYAERLLQNIEKLDWPEKIKIAQRNWIGKSEGAEVNFEVDEEANYVLLHGFTGSVEANFFPWLKNELEKRGKKVWAQNLPNTENPSIEEQADFVFKNAQFDENTVIVTHSLGAVVALKVLEKLQNPVKKLVLVSGFMQPGFLDHERPFEEQIGEFDTQKIKENAGEVVLLRAQNDTAVPKARADYIKEKIGGRIVDFKAQDDHICAEVEPVVLENILTTLKVFTTRPDTLFGATFMVVAPEHPIVASFLSSKLSVSGSNIEEIRKYVEEAQNKSDIERTAEGKVKTGVNTGLFAINPVNSKKIPIFVADYVLAGYGTGAIMAVPAHDQRDFEFAKRYDLPIVPVIQSKPEMVDFDKLPSPSMSSLEAAGSQGDSLSAHHPSSNSTPDEPFEGDGIIIGSGDWNGFHAKRDMGKVLEWLEKQGIGVRKANYHLRDWLISRQRYWGPPIPMIYCEDCFKNSKGEREDMPGWFTVPQDQLPVLLPDVSDWKPMGTGKAPLANHPEFYKTTCPNCLGAAIRETDVSDTFLDSSWYFLRYSSTDIENEAFDTLRTRKWLPVNIYIGGAEHAVLHLLYSRFVTQVLNDLNFVPFDEPFPKLFAHGLIIKDGTKMSKSKGNVVIPDEYIAKYGADTLRSYLMFLGPYKDGGDFRDSGIEGMNRFMRRVWRLIAVDCLENKRMTTEDSLKFERIVHKTIKKVTRDISELSYNTAIASLMELYNELTASGEEGIGKGQIESFLKLLAPFAPHLTEEIWQRLGNAGSIHKSMWPVFQEELTKDNVVIIPIQINGKRRGEIEIESSNLDDQVKIEQMAKEAVAKQLEGQNIKKVIYVEGKILNIVL